MPLLIYWPNKSIKQKIVTNRTSHYNINYTFLDELSNCSSVEIQNYSTGKSLFNNETSQFIIQGAAGYWAVLSSKRILRFKPSGSFEVLNLNYRPEKSFDFEPAQLLNALSVLNKY